MVANPIFILRRREYWLGGEHFRVPTVDGMCSAVLRTKLGSFLADGDGVVHRVVGRVRQEADCTTIRQ